MPVLLFPVRLETRFNNDELWIRVYPDTCQSEVERNYLTEQEADSLIAFFQDGSYDLVMRHGANRANYIAHLGNEYNKISIKVPRKRDLEAALNISIVPEAPLPVANTLPDRFEFRLYDAGGKGFRTEIGKPVKNTIKLGISQNHAAETAWLNDFNEAVAAGMGIRIPITADEAKKGFSKIIVLGLKTSTDAASSASLLENLFDNHYYSNKGLSLLAQGTPTNNTDEESTGYSWSNKWQKQNNEAFAAPHTITMNSEESSTAYNDGEWLSQYLGINDSTFQKVENGRNPLLHTI